MRPHRRALPRALAEIAILAASTALFSCSIGGAANAGASGGIIDLSQGYDFDSGALVSLKGFWSFYPDRLVFPGELAPRRAAGTGVPTEAPGHTGQSRSATGAGAPLEGGFVRVPGRWRSVEGFQRPERPPTGVATLSLRVLVPPGDRVWGLRIPNADSATRVFVNGTQVAELGVVSDDPSDYRPSNRLALAFFRSSGGPLDIVMQVANFSTPYIGTWDSPILGTQTAVIAKRHRDVISTAFVSGALLIMGLYHLGLFLLRKKDKASLLFGLSCLLMTTRNLIMGERLLLELFPPGAAAWEWAFKLEHLSAHLVVPLLALFFRELFPRQIRRGPLAIILSGGALWALLTLSAPAMVYQRFLHWYEYFILVAGLYVVAALVEAALKKEEGAVVVLSGLVFLVGTAANDVLLSVGVLTGSFYMASYGVFIYIFVQSFQLSMLFSAAFRSVEELSNGLKEKNRELESLHTIDLAIASSMELDRVLTLILEQAVQHLGVDAADILMLDPDGVALSLAARSGFRTEALLHTRLKRGEGFAGKALESEGSIVVSDLDTNAEGFNRSPAFSAEGFFFYAGRRLTVKGKIEGVLELYRRSPFRPYASWEFYFETLAGQAAVALDNSLLFQGLRRANRELQEANQATIEGWAEALELRDQETEGHCRRVTEMTLRLAERFGIAGDELDRVRHGALLHDIGKMGIPDSILLKPGPLSEEEFAVMKRHPVIARDLLARLRFLDRSLDIPYYHHEKWDGSGYPAGLSGDEIPLSARLFAVVDVWDALRSDRPYRNGWPEDRVLAHLQGLSGTHFDPDAVSAFIELRREPAVEER